MRISDWIQTCALPIYRPRAGDHRQPQRLCARHSRHRRQSPMTHVAAFDAAFARCPLIAILRGVKPDEVEAIGEALVEAGFTLIEVPLNSPAPLDSIRSLAGPLNGRAALGASTALPHSAFAAPPPP